MNRPLGVRTLVNEDVLLAGLERLREYLRILKVIQQKGVDQFTSDPLIHGAAERYLHLAIESALDIGNHVIFERGYRKPETYGEIFIILSQEIREAQVTAFGHFQENMSQAIDCAGWRQCAFTRYIVGA